MHACMCVHEQVCAFATKPAMQCVLFPPTLFISLIIIFLNLISLISRGAVSVRTAV